MRKFGTLKKIIDRAGKLQSMTTKARFELETSNRVLDGFFSDLIDSELITEDKKTEIVNIAILGEESLHDPAGSTKALDRARSKAARKSLEPGEKFFAEKTKVEDPSHPVSLMHARKFSKEDMKKYKKR